jgi:DNA-binding MarR family transcriptional regulator
MNLRQQEVSLTDKGRAVAMKMIRALRTVV